MARIFEVTTIAGNLQMYEIIEVSPIKFANNAPGTSITTLKSDGEPLGRLAGHAYRVYSMTGLDETIRQYPGADTSPERLRLIYDPLPLGIQGPILRVCPVEGEQIFIAKYDFTKAKLPLENMTFSPEFEGSVDMKFAGLQVLLHLRNFETENRAYYGRDLKKSGNVR